MSKRADYITPFDDLMYLPITTGGMVRTCIYHREEILKDYPEARFKKIPFVNGIQRYATCQRCDRTWTPVTFNPSSIKFGTSPLSCAYCHSKAWQMKPPE